MGRREIKGSHGILIQADTVIENEDFTDGDLLVLPGGMPGTMHLGSNELLISLIREYDAEGKRLSAICAAPSILGQMGLLKGKRATCFPGFEEKLDGAEVLEIPAVTDGRITTGRGMGAAMDFALELVRVLEGEEASVKLAEKIVYRKEKK